MQYVEVQCKTALNRVEGMPFKWSLNPYVGCAHACQYCYARAYYAKAEHGDPGADFESKILVKTNFPEVLRRELARPSWAGELVALGTATDAYQPAEGRFHLTRRVLEALRDHANPVSMVTKSPLVIRDVAVLAELSKSAEVKVFFTVTTVDLGLCRTLEPGTASPLKRLAVMRRLNEAGVTAGVLLAPILPGITDSIDSLEAVAAAAAEHGAAFFGAGTLRLGPVVRQHYLGFVGAAYPDLLPRYERAYSGTYAPREYQDRLNERVERVRERFGFREDTMRSRSSAVPSNAVAEVPPRRRGPQLALPL